MTGGGRETSLTSSVKMANFPLSSMSSSSSLVVVRPAAEKGAVTGDTPSTPKAPIPAFSLPRPRPLPPPTDLQLSLDPVLAPVAVLGLGGVVLRHHLHELAGQRRVLGEGGRGDGRGVGVGTSRRRPPRRRRRRRRRDTCVFRMRKSAEERLRPSSCSMLCSMAAGENGGTPPSTADLLPQGEVGHAFLRSGRHAEMAVPAKAPLPPPPEVAATLTRVKPGGGHLQPVGSPQKWVSPLERSRPRWPPAGHLSTWSALCSPSS